MKWALIGQGAPGSTTLAQALKGASQKIQFDRLDVAVAYATLQGVKALELAIGSIPPKSRWIVGLDDAITQPEAIDYLMNLQGSEIRVAKMTPAKRFHPKLYCLWSTLVNAQYVSAIGSGNMTLNGMRKNGETAAIMTAETSAEAKKLKNQWQAMWKLGHSPSEDELKEYREIYKKAKKQRKKIVDLGSAPPEPEPDAPVDDEPTFDGAPNSATISWLEAGSPSAGGRDLEFPKAMMPYFGLKKNKETRKFRMADGSVHALTFTERTNNQMWRLLFTSSSINSAIGRDTMRPISGGNRSDLAVLFRRTLGSKDFEVEIMKVTSEKFKTIRANSKSISGTFATTKAPGGRLFGIY